MREMKIYVALKIDAQIDARDMAWPATVASLDEAIGAARSKVPV